MKKPQRDEPALRGREHGDRLDERAPVVAVALVRGYLVDGAVRERAFDNEPAAPRIVDEASLRDRVQQGRQGGGRPIRGRESNGRVKEHVLRKILSPVGIAGLADEVAANLRMVAPEGQLGEAFHLLSLSRADEESNGLG